MSRVTTNQANYQIIQTGGKLDMSNQGTTAVEDALGYPGARAKLEALFVRRFGSARLATIRNNAKNGRR